MKSILQRETGEAFHAQRNKPALDRSFSDWTAHEFQIKAVPDRSREINAMVPAMVTILERESVLFETGAGISKNFRSEHGHRGAIDVDLVVGCLVECGSTA